MILAHTFEEGTISVRGRTTQYTRREQVNVAEYPAARTGGVKAEMLSVCGTQSKGHICILTQCEVEKLCDEFYI